MWHDIHVARALFTWEKWRASIVHQWMNEPSLYKLSSLSDLRLAARTALQELGLKGPVMTLYWICSVDSVCNLDDESNFLKIVIPSWLLERKFNPRQTKYHLTPGNPVSPPSVITAMDLLERYPESNRGLYPKLNSSEILLSENHPLCSILRVRGRHKKHGRKSTKDSQTLHGFYDEITKEEDSPKSTTDRPSEYSDRLAVICAALRRKGLTNVKIANMFGLPITEPYSSKQSDKVQYLIKRGKKLIEKYDRDKSFGDSYQ